MWTTLISLFAASLCSPAAATLRLPVRVAASWYGRRVSRDEERVVWSGRPSWRGRVSIFAPGLLLAVLVLVLGLLLGLDVVLALVLTLAIAAVTLVWGLLETIRWRYTITNRRVFVRHGLVLDTFLPTAASDVFEDAVSVAASFAAGVQAAALRWLRRYP